MKPEKPISRGQALRLMAKRMKKSHSNRVNRSKVRHLRKAHGLLGR